MTIIIPIIILNLSIAIYDEGISVLHEIVSLSSQIIHPLCHIQSQELVCIKATADVQNMISANIATILTCEATK